MAFIGFSYHWAAPGGQMSNMKPELEIYLFLFLIGERLVVNTVHETRSDHGVFPGQRFYVMFTLGGLYAFQHFSFNTMSMFPIYPPVPWVGT